MSLSAPCPWAFLISSLHPKKLKIGIDLEWGLGRGIDTDDIIRFDLSWFGEIKENNMRWRERGWSEKEKNLRKKIELKWIEMDEE